MWQRHIQPLAFSGTSLAERRRLGVVDEAHVPAVGELARVDLVVAPPRRPLLLVEVLGAPCSALCISFVALKNSSRP